MPELDARAMISALCLPASARVDQRVPKKLLLENAAPTASDKRLIADAIEEIQWIAALKPNTVGISDYSDEQREYLEIAVLTLALRDLGGKPAKAVRLNELLHRSVPYPLLLITQGGGDVILTLAHKRWAQNQANKMVIDGALTHITIPAANLEDQLVQQFLASLSLDQQRRANLMTLYQSWINVCDALQAATKTGRFQLAANPGQAAARRQALEGWAQRETELARLRQQAKSERQIARQVALNLEIKRLQAELQNSRELL